MGAYGTNYEHVHIVDLATTNIAGVPLKDGTDDSYLELAGYPGPRQPT